MKPRTPALVSFENSLRFSLRQAIGSKTPQQIRFGSFFCDAPLHELMPENLSVPEALDLLIDLEFDSGIQRIWFELEYVWQEEDSQGNQLAVYHATCEDF